VLSPRAAFPVAAQLRSADGIALGELFAHMSGLYFRGKLTYARRFGAAQPGAAWGAFIITPDRGLLPAEAAAGVETLRQFAAADIRLDNPAYQRPLEQTAAELAAMAPPPADFVLLGSIASEKYVQVLTRVFGPRLLFPADFVGRGDMSRGGLLLRAAAAGRELDYIPVIGAIRRGVRPPRLEPLRVKRPA
jgi:hypothetical protein